MQLKWAIYYESGEIYYGETETDALGAPRVGVQMYKEQADHLPRGYSLRHGCSFLCWTGWRWSSKNDETGWTDYLIHKDGVQKILIGREIYDETYQAIGKQADKDGCFCTQKGCTHTIPNSRLDKE